MSIIETGGQAGCDSDWVTDFVWEGSYLKLIAAPSALIIEFNSKLYRIGVDDIERYYKKLISSCPQVVLNGKVSTFGDPVNWKKIVDSQNHLVPMKFIHWFYNEIETLKGKDLFEKVSRVSYEFNMGTDFAFSMVMMRENLAFMILKGPHYGEKKTLADHVMKPSY